MYPRTAMTQPQLSADRLTRYWPIQFARARKGAKAVVIGGGLLGLEAARGLQVQGCEVTVVHLMDSLMERQFNLTYINAKGEGPDASVWPVNLQLVAWGRFQLIIFEL